MRSLVTGGAGFIGSHLVDALVDRGMGEVVVLDNLRRGRRQNLSRHLDSPTVEFVEADLRDYDAVRAACDGVDAVFHLAAQSNVIGASSDPTYSVETNVVGTVNLLRAASEAEVERVVFSSSREVYGEPAELPVHEGFPLASKNLYGASKIAGEIYCRAFQGRGLDVRILRFANVYGPRDTERVIPLWLDRAREGLDLQVYGGKQIIDFIWIETATAALLSALAAPSLPGPINIGSGQGTAIVTLAERILELTESKSRICLVPPRTEEVVGFIADVALMRQCLRLEPPASPLVGLASMAPGCEASR